MGKLTKKFILKSRPSGDVKTDNFALVEEELPTLGEGEIKVKARIILCGQISLYNMNRLSMGPRLFPQFLIHRVKMQGFIVYDYENKFPEAQNQLKHWIVDGTIKYDENIIYGFENLPTAFLGLFSGENIGKQLVKV